jgi:hypothetical protein
MKKMGVDSLADLVRVAERLGVTKQAFADLANKKPAHLPD